MLLFAIYNTIYMRTLKESLLSDLDTTMSIGDDFDKMHKKVEKDYKIKI